MILDWLKRIFGISTPTGLAPDSESKGGGQRNTLKPKTPYDRLDERKKNAREEKGQIKSSSTDWYSLSLPEHETRKSVPVYQAYRFGEVLNLKALKEERLKREAHELKILEDEVKALLLEIEKSIENRRADDARTALGNVIEKIVNVKDTSIRQKHQQLQSRLAKLTTELEQEDLARLAEERQRREEEAQRQKEEEVRAKKEKERKEREERERRKEEANRLADDARRKEDAEQQERQRLDALSSELKDDWQSFKDVLDENGVRYLYHFTDERNIPSIKRHSGLFSWHYCHTHDITIPCQGGDYDSQELDKKYGLEDYVRLSFCDDHPMAYRLKQSGSNIKILKIKADVALLKDVQFSDMNAADKRHTHGKALEHLQMVNFEATKMHYLRSDNPNFKPHQAEVMVRTFIPLKYIVNL